MRVAVEFTLEARVFGTNHERGAHLTGRTGVHGSDGGVVSLAESHRSIVAVHHQEGDRIEIGADQARRSEIGSTGTRCWRHWVPVLWPPCVRQALDQLSRSSVG